MDTDRKSHAQLLVEERTGRRLEELLRDLYVDKRHSQEEIAEALSAKIGTDISRGAVKLWLKTCGITRDDRPAVAL